MRSRIISARAVVVSVVAIALITAACSNDGLPMPPSSELTVTSVVPDSAPSESPVPRSGSGFRAGAIVTFGGAQAHVVSVVNTVITAVTPVHPDGRVNIVVTNPGGDSVTVDGGFTYGPLALTGLSPSAGIIGKVITVSGLGFLSGATVAFDGIPAMVVQSGTSILAVTPEHGEGSVDVVVTNPGGASAMRRGGFTYQKVTLSVGATAVAVGEPVDVSWVAPPAQSRDDWIGLFRVGDPSSNYLWYKYTNAATSGTVTAKAPTQAGVYEFRYLPDDLYNVTVRSAPFTVK